MIFQFLSTEGSVDQSLDLPPLDTTKVVIDAMTHNYRFSFLCWHSVGIRKYFSHGKLLLPAEKNIKLWTIKFLLLPEYIKENWADSTCLSVSNDGSMAVQSTFGKQSKHSSSLPTPLHTNTYTPKYSMRQLKLMPKKCSRSTFCT